jgi:uncharacterized membrane protein YbhN (UPF0104 family)
MASLGEGLSTVGTTRRLLVSLTLSLLMWFCFLASYTLLFHALDINQNWSEMAAIAAALLVVLPPSTPAMIGVFQGVTVSVLVPFQITNTSNLVAYGILLYAVMMIFWVITGLWGVKQTQLNVRELVKLRGFKKPEDMELDPDHSAEELDI